MSRQRRWSMRCPKTVIRHTDSKQHGERGGKQGEFKAPTGERAQWGGGGVGLCWQGCGGTGCGRQSDSRGLREFGNLRVKKGQDQLWQGQGQHLSSAERCEAAEPESKGAATGKLQYHTHFPLLSARNQPGNAKWKVGLRVRTKKQRLLRQGGHGNPKGAFS